MRPCWTTGPRSPTTIRSLLLISPERLEWRSAETPELRSDDVLIRTTVGAVSIGSEVPLYRGSTRRLTPVRYPLMSGYENVGIVVARGKEARDLEIGDRVVASYGHRSYGVVPEGAANPAPEDVSDELALLSILTCDVAKGIRKLAPRPEEAVLVTGGGAIGLLTLFVLRAYGVRYVDVIEPQEDRRGLAMELGARRTLVPERADDLDAYAAGFECSANAAAFSLLQEKMRPGGRICVLSDGNVEPLVLNPAFHEKELLVVGSSDGWDYREHARWYFDVVRGGRHPLESVFQLETGFEDLPQAFERMASGQASPVKVLVRY